MDNGGLAEHDPFRALKESEKAGVKPGFLGGAEGKEKSSAKAAESLGAAEQAASGDLYKPKDGVESAREEEEQAGGFYSGEGREASNKKKPTGFRGVVMRGGPIYAILFTIFIAGGVMFGTQTFQPFSLVAQFMENFNSMHTSANVRSERFFKAQMSKRKTKSPYNIFGTDFSLSEKQKTKLAEQGIEYDGEYDLDGKKTKVLKYKDADGVEKIVTADNFKSMYSTDVDFFQKYNAGSMTWRGQIANWFGTNTSTFLKNNKLTRNMWEKYEEKLQADGADAKNATMEEKKKAVIDTIEERVKGEGDLDMQVAKKNSEEEDGRVTDPEDSSVSRGVSSEADVREKVTDIASKYGSGANLACAFSNAIGAINLLVTANQALQIIQLTTAFFESVDKAKAGYGDVSPIMVFASVLNERKKTTNVVLEGGENGLDSLKSVAVVRDRTPMEAEGIAAMYSGSKVNPNDPSVASFNVYSNTKKVLGGVGTDVGIFEKCSVARIGAAAISAGNAVLCASALIGNPVSVVGCEELLRGVGFDLVRSATVSTLVSFLIPTIASSMMRDVVSELGGENLGNAFRLGAKMYQGGAHRASGGSLMSLDMYKKFAVAQNQVIAENAKYERESLSPFDMTSKYTFMGSIMTQMMSFVSANSVMSTVTAGGSVMTSSLASLSGTASAFGIAETLPNSIEEYAEVNPALASIGAIGDGDGYQYTGSDLSTADIDPDEVLEYGHKQGWFCGEDSNGNPTICSDSELADYIKYCTQRQSAFGIADQNIANSVGNTGDVETGSATFDAATNGAIGAIPVLGDAIDIIQGVEQLNNIGYITGESCVAGNDVKSVSSPNWNEARWAAQYIFDQSLAESMGVIEKSAVAAFLEDYYEENPLDNSYEGILARYSGLTKDNVIALLDIIEYENYIASYDPSDRYVFGDDELKDEGKVVFEKEDVMGGVAVMPERIVYADVRNRSFVV